MPRQSKHTDLTPREKDVLTLVAEGLTNPEIAARLFITVNSAKSYVRDVKNKLGAKDRSHLQQLGQSLLAEKTTSNPEITHKFPAAGTALIGREEELARLDRLLREKQMRLVTILAPGGMGKTRLAIEIAHQYMYFYPDGIVFVDLTVLDGANGIVSLIGESVGYQLQRDGRSPHQQLLDFLSSKNMLLILDNFEHVLDAAPLVVEIIRHAPALSVLITSRERLNLNMETVFILQGLQADFTNGISGDAVAMVVDSGRRVRPDFTIRKGDEEAVKTICQLTEGMPLALLLAMNWLDVLTLQQIAAELRHSMLLLQADYKDLPERHSSIRAVFDPTWQRLTNEEKIVFAQMSVFRGGCTREAVEAVTGASLFTLQSLTQKALISRTAEGRYVIHELLRQYAAEKLDDAPRQDVLSRHTAYYAEEICKITWLPGNHLETWRADLENYRQMWFRLLEQEQWQQLANVADALMLLLHLLNLYQDNYQIFHSTLERLQQREDVPQTFIARLQIYEAKAANYVEKFDGVCEHLESGLRTLLVQPSLTPHLTPLRDGLLTLFGCDADPVMYLNWVEQVLVAGEAANDHATIVYCLNIKAASIMYQHPDDARDLLIRALTLVEAGAGISLGWTMEVLGLVELLTCNYEAALQAFVSSYEEHESRNYWAYQVTHLSEIALTAELLGDYEMALEQYQMALDFAQRMGWKQHEFRTRMRICRHLTTRKDADGAWSQFRIIESILEDRLDYQHCHFWLRKGEILLIEEKLEEAHSTVHKALEFYPNSIDAFRALSEICYHSGDSERALQYIEKAIRLEVTETGITFQSILQKFPHTTLWLLVDLANVLPDEDKAALLTYIIDHRGTSAYDRQRAQDALATVQPIQHENHFAGMDLDTVVADVLTRCQL